MFVMCHFAGPAAHKPAGRPLGSARWRRQDWCFERGESAGHGTLAATVWGTGVCYMWPMLAAASERFLAVALADGSYGTAGILSIYFVLPEMKIFDRAKIEAAGGEAALTDSGDAYTGLAIASNLFRYVAVLPAILDRIWRNLAPR
jgi:hypothetical protein